MQLITPEQLQQQTLKHTYQKDPLRVCPLDKSVPREALNLSDLFQNPNNKDLETRLKQIYQTTIDQQNPTISLSFLRPIYQPPNLINNYFDQIYILNLDCRPDRMDHMRQQLHRLGIYNYRRFSALYGKEEPHYSEWQQYQRVPMTRLERTKYQRKGIGSPGSWAILKSMYLMLREAQANQYQNFLVFQDDLLFHKQFNQSFEHLVNHPTFPKDWKLFYLGGTQHAWSHVDFHKNHMFYHPNGTCDGAFAVAIDSSIYQEMIDEILRFDLPVDSGALKTLQRLYSKKSIVAFPNLAIADIRDSDLRGYRSLERFGQKFRWDLNHYHVVDNLKPKSTVSEPDTDKW